MRVRFILAASSSLLFAVACGTDDGEASAEARRVGGGREGGAAASSGGSNGVGADPDEIHHVLSTGQSNSVGFAGTPVLSTEQRWSNVMFDTGVMTAVGCDDDGCRGYAKPTKLVPLVEGDAYFAYGAETMSSGLANLVAKESGASLLLSVHGRSGNTYVCLRKGGCDFLLSQGYTSAFDEALKQVTDGKALANATGKRYRVGAVTAVHGESDHYSNPYPLPASRPSDASLATYSDALLEWQRDYDASIRAISGQKEAVPLLVSQMSNWNDRPSSEIPRHQLDAHVRSQGKVVLVGPTYMLPFADDCIHFTNHGLRRLGEYFAKVYTRVVINGEKWEPLRPLEATLSSSTVRVRFAVPRPPLVFDTSNVVDPGNYGFEVVDAAGAIAPISRVDLAGADTVAITLASTPSPPLRVRYAMTAIPQTCPGPQRGPRGNLRDSDDAASNYGYQLENWAAHFEIDVR